MGTPCPHPRSGIEVSMARHIPDGPRAPEVSVGFHPGAKCGTPAFRPRWESMLRFSAQRRALLQLSAFARGGGVPATQQIAPMDLDFSEPTDEKDPRSDSRSKTFQSTEF